jgi:uncharacterized membrane protein
MRGSSLVAPILIVAGVAAVVAAVATGGARAEIIVVVPVLFGSSVLFLAGVLLLVAGIFTIPFTLGASSVEPDRAPAGASGGLLLVGPIPIFWGSGTRVSRRTRIAAAVAGALLLVIAAVLFLGWLR